MRSPTDFLRVAPCLLAAAACLLLTARPAGASCGDYVHVRTPGSQATPDPSHQPPADSPCAHGRCDRLPFTPPSPEPTAPTGGGGTDAVLAAVVVPPAPAVFGFAADYAGVAVHFPSVPFLPPRV